MTKVRFHSDSGYQLFCDQIDMRYPTNKMDKDEFSRTITFNGDKPNHQIQDLAQDHGGHWEHS